MTTLPAPAIIPLNELVPELVVREIPVGRFRVPAPVRFCTTWLTEGLNIAPELMLKIIALFKELLNATEAEAPINKVPEPVIVEFKETGIPEVLLTCKVPEERATLEGLKVFNKFIASVALFEIDRVPV